MKTTKSALEMSKELQKLGYSVRVIFRKEGGARITKINGKSFKGSKGNIEARSILGASLTESQKAHLEKIKQKKGVFGRPKLETISPEFLKMKNQINREFKKQGKTARVTNAKIRARMKLEGSEGVRKYLNTMLDKVRDYADISALEAWIKRIELDASMAPEVQVLADLMKDKITQGNKMLEYIFESLLDLTYDWEKGTIPLKSFIRKGALYINTMK